MTISPISLLHYFYFSLISILLFGCSNLPIKTPEQLYADTSKHIHQIQNKSKSYNQALAHYKKAQKNIDFLLKNHPSLVLVADLKYNQKKIAGLTLKQFQGLEDKLKKRAKAELSPLACALLVTENVETDKYLSLIGIANLFDKANKRPEAIKLLKKRYRKVKLIPITEESDLATSKLIDIAGAYIKMGYFSEAKKILIESEANARSMKAVFWRYLLLKDIVIEYANMGDFDKAVKVKNLIYKRSDQDVAVNELAYKLLEKGSLKRLISIVPMIESPAKRVRIYFQVANAYAEKGNKGRAKEIRSKGFNLTSSIDIATNPKEKVSSLVQVAKVYAKMDLKEEQDRVLQQALQIAKSMTDLKQRSFALDYISSFYTEIGRMDKAFKVVKQMKGSLGKDFPYASIAAVYAETGHFNKALQTMNKMRSDLEKDLGFHSIIEYMVKADKLSFALQVTSSSIKDEIFSRSGAYQLISNAYIKRKNLTTALEVTKKIKGNETKAESLIAIALAVTHSRDNGILADIVQEVTPMADIRKPTKL